MSESSGEKFPIRVVALRAPPLSPLLAPGVMVIRRDDGLVGWVVDGVTERLVCAPYEVEAELHLLSDATGEWAMVLWRDGRVVPESWDRLKRVEGLYRETDLPTFESALKVASLAVRSGLADGVTQFVMLDGRFTEVL